MRTIKADLKINSKYFLEIVNLLRNNGAEVRLVGGCVRDAYLCIDHSDIDMATDFTPDQVMDICRRNSIKIIPTGIKFGTVTAIIDKEHFEITTLRSDINCDGRYAEVKFSKDFAEDAVRRDFTINALSYCPIEHLIYDYYGGIEDIKNRKLVFIGDAKERIKEDYLRILRFFRFSARYANEIDKDALNDCILYKSNLKKLSKERIKSELDLILMCKNSHDILAIMFDSGIIEEILPISEYSKEIYSNIHNVVAKFGINIDLVLIYAALFYDSNIKYDDLMNLKFSRIQAKNIIKLLELSAIEDIDALLIKLKLIWINETLPVRFFVFAFLISQNKEKMYNTYVQLKNVTPIKLPIYPKDLMDIGYKGKEVGQMLEKAKLLWVKSDFTATGTELINLIKNHEK